MKRRGKKSKDNDVLLTILESMMENNTRMIQNILVIYFMSDALQVTYINIRNS